MRELCFLIHLYLYTLGSFTYQFNTPGIYYYWSGLVDSNTISFRGIVEVIDGNDKELEINVKLNGINGN